MINFAVGSGLDVEFADIVKYPAGEFNIKTQEPFKKGLAYTKNHDPEDLILLNLFADLCRRNGAQLEVFMPYFPAAREDRGAPLGAKVYADIVNLAGASKVTIVDPHSDVVPALLNNCQVIGLDFLVPWALKYHAWKTGEAIQYDGVIAPDGGAVKRAWGVAKALGVPMYQATKRRDVSTGKLSGFSCEPLPEGRLLIVDDICDGGGTFIGLADTCHRNNLDLWVTHGIFTGDNLALEAKFNKIFTTDSFDTEAPANATRFRLSLAMEDYNRKQ